MKPKLKEYIYIYFLGYNIYIYFYSYQCYRLFN